MDLSTLKNILTVANAEKRLTRRLKRYWLFLVLAYVSGIGIFIYYSVIHAFFSSFSATLGAINPHYLLSVYGLLFQIIFTIGIVFIAFDIRARDVRERIVEVLDCRPISNLELIVGRFLALFQLAWYPVLILCVLLQLIGWLLPKLGLPIGSTVELNSLLAFAFVLAIPSFFFSISMVFLVTLLVKNRVLSAIVSVGVLGGLFAGLFRLPINTYPYFDNFGVTVTTPFPTDMITTFATPEGWLQRIGFIIISCALLGYAAVIHPRLDDSNRRRTAMFSSILLAAGFSLLVASSLVLTNSLSNKQWLEAHESVENNIAPDIVHMDAELLLEPGKSLQVALSLEIKAPNSGDLDSALFSLNPGFTMTEVNDSNGNALAFSHENGLLQVTLPTTLTSGQSAFISVVYSGKPINQFAYLDSRLKYENLQDFNARGLLGTEPAMFDKQFVALMPGNYWLPLAGNDLNRNDNRSSPKDYFTISLEIELPKSWLVAGPGARKSISALDASNSRFSFAPTPAISEVALVASEYASFTSRINDIDFEFLVYPKHTRNFEVLAPLQEEIEAWLSSRLLLAEDAGLKFPFDAFTLVEVPNGLRVYKGGWRMDTALAPPGMMLVNESGFPTSRFDFSIFSNAQKSTGGTTGQGININSESFKNINFDRLLTFFTSDLSGGNIFMGASRSYFAHHSSATGEEAIALDFILDMLATLVVSDERYYFSMYNDINSTVTNLISTVAGGNNTGPGIAGQSLTQQTISNATTDVRVWNSALNSSLISIDTTQDPRETINLLTLKGGELAQAIYDVLGPQQSGAFLALILQDHRASSFRLDDVVRILASFNEDLSLLFEESFTSSLLPGFVTDSAELYRLPDGSNGEQRYQLLVAVRNDEPVSGFTRISWLMEDEEQDFYSSAPIRIPGQSAIEFGVVLSKPSLNALVTPYLSLNRTQFIAGIFTDTDAIKLREVEAFEGVRTIPWQPVSERIIADDLDSSFVVIDDYGQSSSDMVAAEDEWALDQGIRINRGNTPNNWNRILSPSAYGKYRHTYVSIIAGEGDKKAILSSDIPSSGLWDLEIHIPFANGQTQDQMRGIWNIEVVTDGRRETIAFDNREAVSGWNLIGSYELPAGEVKIELTNKTDAVVVRVDAFAWTPVNTNNGAQ